MYAIINHEHRVAVFAERTEMTPAGIGTFDGYAYYDGDFTAVEIDAIPEDAADWQWVYNPETNAVEKIPGTGPEPDPRDEALETLGVDVYADAR